MRQYRRYLAIGAACAVTLAVAGPAAASTSEVTGFDATTTERIDRAVSDAFIPANSPGYAVAVWAPGLGTYMRAYGVANRRTGAPLQVEDHFRVGSVTKTMTAVTVLRLVDQGKLSLDDHLEKYVTGVPNSRIITVRQLLAMRAGIHDFSNDPAYAHIVNQQPPWTVNDSIRVIRRMPPDYPPGTRAVYTNANYILLGRIIEKVTGRPAADVIRDEVLVPAGLTDTTLPSGTGMPGPFRRGYVPVEGSVAMKDTTIQNPYLVWTAGYSISSLRDLGRWATVFATGALLSRATFAKQRQGSRLQGAPAGSSYGLGMSFAPGGWAGHTGYVAGYNTAMYHQASTGTTIVVTGNHGVEQALMGVDTVLRSLR